ncbi:hypothetical protein J6590_096006 [Homalodisca vitripennis]|nr:hypothetical protein J6590_096006 [Homalodisca vitripennis]
MLRPWRWLTTEAEVDNAVKPVHENAIEVKNFVPKANSHGQKMAIPTLSARDATQYLSGSPLRLVNYILCSPQWFSDPYGSAEIWILDLGKEFCLGMRSEASPTAPPFAVILRPERCIEVPLRLTL